MFQKKHVRLFVLTAVTAHSSLVSTTMLKAGDAIPRVLLVGDSWTSYMWSARSIGTALLNNGLGRYEERGSRTALGGSTAAQWAQPSYLQLVTEELTTYPTIDVVLFCVGGNDRMQGRTFAQIAADIEVFVDHVLAFRSDIKVLFLGYTYLAADFGYPSFRVQNDLWTEFERTRFEITRRKDRMYYQLNLGLLQATFGFPPHFEAGDVPLPGGPPDYVPFQGGDPDFGAPPLAFQDNLHLTTAGYLAVAERTVGLFLAEWLGERECFQRGDANTDAADANDDGGVDVDDAIAGLGHLFASAGDLPEPFAGCGVDPSDDSLPCERYDPCQQSQP